MGWKQLLANINRRWKNATVSALPPIPMEDSDGKTFRLIIEFNTWLKECYGNSILYLKDTWNMIIEKLSKKQDQTVDLGHTLSYTIALPKSLTDDMLTPHHFHSDSSLAITVALDDQATFELLGTLTNQLHNDFGCRAHATDLICGELAELQGPQTTTKTGNRIIVLGGSHCRRSIQYLTDAGHNVVDLTVPGWLPTDGNIESAMTEIKGLGDLSDSIAILDLISNVAYRYEQAIDGQLLLAEKRGGKFHMMGKVTTCPRNLLKHILLRLKPLLDTITCVKICLAPLPRYLFSGCCDNEGHCIGIGEPGYAIELYQKSLSLRKNMRELLTGVHTRLVIPELYSEMFPGATSPAQVLEELRRVSEDDGVHLTADGYAHWMKAILATFDPTSEKKEAVLVSKPAMYFWRGFVSPRGAERPKNMASYHANKTHGGGTFSRGRGMGGQSSANRGGPIGRGGHGVRGGLGGRSGRGQRGHGPAQHGQRGRRFQPY
jgi:hypothetical protein